MANNVANVDAVTDAMGGVALAEPTTPLAPSWLPALRGAGEQSSRAVRSHLKRLPDVLPHSAVIPVEEPLVQTDTAPGFSALRRVAVGNGPIADMTIDAASGRMFVTNHADDSVSVLDASTLSVRATITDLYDPFAVTIADGHAYVSTASFHCDAVTMVAPGAADPITHPMADSVRDIVANPDGKHIYVARTGRDGADMAAIDTTDGRVTTVELGTRHGATAEAITVSRDGSRVFLATVDHLGGEVVTIDTDARRVVSGLAFDTSVRDLAVSADGGVLFVAGDDAAVGGIVDVVDTASMRVLGTVELGNAATQLTLSASGERLYIVNGDRVTVMCTRTYEVIDTVTAVGEPSCVTESADGKWLYIADFDGGITILTVASSTESLLAQMMSDDDAVIDVPMLELERADRV